MSELTPFQKSALDYRKHISLTANAGSGKTFVLAKRYVEIAANEDISLNKIVAITFTEKAAGELNKKIAAEIEEQIKKESDEKRLRILYRIRRQLTSANISTIHSFCINLLREFSPEAGIDANFTPLNQIDADEQLDLVLEDFIRNNLTDSEITETLKNVIRLLGGKNNFENEIRSIVKDRKNIERLREKLYSKSDEEIAQFYNKFIDDSLRYFIEDDLSELFIKIEYLNDLVLDLNPESEFALNAKLLLSEVIKENNPRKVLEILNQLTEQILTKSLSVKKKGYINKEYNNHPDLIGFIELKFSDLKSLLELNYDEKNLLILIDYSKQIFALADKILEEYNKRKRKYGYLDFEDILIETKKLTSNNDFVKQLYDKYDYIMIDEYQDTNEIQYEIFMPILNNLKHGNLFVVGDEKQSIYMFRDAELEVFTRTRNEITTVNKKGDLLLPHSFRVAPEIAQFVNEVFRNLLTDPNPLYNEVEYDELVCSRPETDKGNVEILLADEEIEEAEIVADNIIEKINNENAAAGEFAILCRKRNSFYELEKVFNDKGIPYLIAGGKGFFQRQTVYDIYNYLSFLLNPGDDAALVGILRSPFYLLSDEEIFEISLTEGDSYFEKLKSFSDGKGEYSKIIKQLEHHIKLSSSVRISALLKEIFRDTQYWGVIAGKKNFEQEISNLFKLIGVARGFTLQSFKTLYDFKVYLDEAISLFEDEGQAQLSDYSDAVKIMTLHQSKGLEFKRVILYKCNDNNRESSVKAKSLLLDKNLGILTKVPRHNKFFSEYISPAIIEVQNHIQNKKQNAEVKRLLYVGMTRAVDELIISAKAKKNSFTQNSFIDLIAQGLKTDLFKDEIKLDSSLHFMKGPEESFDIYEKELRSQIEVKRNIELTNNFEISKTRIEPLTDFKLMKIVDHEKNEIVSATKIAIFTQCPTKYYLTYELGYTELLKVTRTFSNIYDFKQNEDEDVNIYADIKGQIIHKIFELEIEQNDLNNKLDDLIPKFLKGLEEINLEEVKNKIIADLEKYYQSETYNRLKSAQKFYNEYEIYSKEEDYYVYGIIDKLVIEDDQIIIVDYKTDNLSKSTIEEKAKHYEPQLKFYSYSISKKFKSVKNIKVLLVFIQKPDKPVEFNFSAEEIADFGKYIRKSVNTIRKGQFTKNLDHCPKCHFNLFGKCVYQQ